MADSPLLFLSSIGPGFGLVFVMLAGGTIYLQLLARDQAHCALQAVDDATQAVLPPMGTAVGPGLPDAADVWAGLAAQRASLQATVQRAQLVCGSIPTLALLGTCVGFFFAIAGVGQMDLAGTDPLALLGALMDGGIGTALATTVCGQGLYFILGQSWAVGVAGPVAHAHVRLAEGLVLTREIARQDREAA